MRFSTASSSDYVNLIITFLCRNATNVDRSILRRKFRKLDCYIRMWLIRGVQIEGMGKANFNSSVRGSL